MPSLQKILTGKDNDYTELAKLFKKRTGLDIINDGYTKKIPVNKGCSIIIPFYKNYLFLRRNLISLCHQNLPSEFKENKVEIIIINDGSLINIKKIIQQTRRFYSVIYLKLKKNYGRATARNLGLLYAQNDIVIFLDEDVVAPKDFVGGHLLRHEFLNKCIIAGFRQNISPKELVSRLDIRRQSISRRPNYRKDFRHKRFVPMKWKEIYKDIPRDNFNKTYYPLKESNYFKKFDKGRIMGVWDLPFMFLTCNVSIPRKYIFEVGGFDMRFKGWNLEDTHLGAKLIARGLYLIPNLHTTVYHLTKGVFRGKDKEKKFKEFKKNVKLYKKLKKEKFILFKENEWKKKMKKYFTNKFNIG